MRTAINFLKCLCNGTPCTLYRVHVIHEYCVTSPSAPVFYFIRQYTFILAQHSSCYFPSFLFSLLFNTRVSSPFLLYFLSLAFPFFLSFWVSSIWRESLAASCKQKKNKKREKKDEKWKTRDECIMKSKQMVRMQYRVCVWSRSEMSKRVHGCVISARCVCIRTAVFSFASLISMINTTRHDANRRIG